MTPQKQTEFGQGKGNCLAACVASILDIPLSDVPNFVLVPGDYHAAMIDWLETKGYETIHLSFYGDSGEVDTDEEDAPLARCYDHGHGRGRFCILAGVSPRTTPDGGRMYHAVVGTQKGWGFKVVFDPHPSDAGIVGPPYSATWLIKKA